MLLATFSESKVLGIIHRKAIVVDNVFARRHRLFDLFVPHLELEFDKVFVVLVEEFFAALCLLLECFFDVDTHQGAENAFGEMELRCHVDKSLYRGQVTFAALADHHGIFEGELPTPLLDRINRITLVNDTLLEFVEHLGDELVVEVDLLDDLLDVDWL